MMPNDLPHWKTCDHYFRLWTKLGYWEQIQIALRDKARLAVKKSPDRCDYRSPKRSDS
jgi:transposase